MNELATDKQIAFLAKRGKFKEGMTKQEAHQIISELIPKKEEKDEVHYAHHVEDFETQKIPEKTTLKQITQVYPKDPVGLVVELMASGIPRDDAIVHVKAIKEAFE